MDGISPFPRSEADARYDLARLAELLPQVGKHLKTLGVDAELADTLADQAADLRRQVAAAREATLVNTARRIPA